MRAEAQVRADAALDRFLPRDAPEVVREHRVTALLVAHDGAAWLPRTVAGLAAQRRAPDRVVAVDAGSTDDSATLMARVADVRVRCGAEEGLAGALAAGVAAVEPPVGGDAVVDWYWIVHDDSAPEPDCLAELLNGADRHPRAVIVAPKAVAWSDPAILVGIGHRWAPGTPVVERLEIRERDQGQFDFDRAVYAADSAGMLVRADVWHALGGMDAGAGQWAGPADLCRRAWGSGGQAVFIPGAVVAHRLAGHRGIRALGDDRDRPRRAARRGQLHLELTQAPALALPGRYLRAMLSTLLRTLAALLTREPEESSAELAGAWDVLGHPLRLRAARARLRQPPVTSVTRPAEVRAYRGTVLRRAFERWILASRIRWRPPSRWRIPARVWRPLALAAVLALGSVVRDPGQLIGSGSLQGGGLLPAPSARALLSDYLSSWHDVWLGSAGVPPAYLAVLAAAGGVALGSVDLVLRLAAGLAVPLAFLSAWVGVGPRRPGRERALLALAWACLPAGVSAAGAGRISTLALLLLGPLAARALHLWWTAAVSGGAGVRRALAAGTMLGLTASFAPLALPLAIIAGAGEWARRHFPLRPIRGGAIVVAATLPWVAPWLPRLGEVPWLVLTDLGRADSSLGDPAPWVWGLTPGGPASLMWPGVPLLAMAVLAVLLARHGRRALGGLAAVLLLLVVVAWIPALARQLWPQLDPGVLWPGQPLLVAGGVLALVVAQLVRDPGPAQLGLRVGWSMAVGALVVGWWVTPAGPTTVTDSSALPPVVVLDAEGADRPRTLVLSRSDGSVTYAVVAGPGSRLGDADVLAGAVPDPGLVDAVQRLVSGAGLAVEAELGGRGIRYVVVAGSPGDRIIAELDAAVGLRRLASSAEQSLWLVTDEPVRARLSAAAGTGRVLVPILTEPTTIDVVLHPSTVLPRRLLLAEAGDPDWTGTLDGRALPLSVDERGMVVAPLDAPGRLTVSHEGAWRWVAPLQLAVMAALIVLSLPKRRTIDVDAQAQP